MKLDSQLLYNILETIEVIQTTFKPINVREDFSSHFSDYEMDVVVYHVELLEDLGLISGNTVLSVRATDGSNYVIKRLTFNGHVLLHNIREKSHTPEEDDHDVVLRTSEENDPA